MNRRYLSTMQPAGGEGQGGQQQQQQGGFSIGRIIQFFLIYYLITSWFGGNKTPTNDPITGVVVQPHINLWNKGQEMELRVFLSNASTIEEFDAYDSPPLWKERNLNYDSTNEKNARHFTGAIPLTHHLQHNGSLYLHAFLSYPDVPINPEDPSYKEKSIIHLCHPLVHYILEPKKEDKTRLLSGDKKPSEITPSILDRKIISYWSENVTLNVVEDHTRYSNGGLPPPLQKRMKFRNHRYYPTFFVNEFWTLREHMYPINDTLSSLPLYMDFGILTNLKWQFIVQMEESFTMQKNLGTSGEENSDEIKRMLLDTNPYLLGVTVVVSLLHMIFDFLAFKNDISFWKNNKSMEGLSVRTVFLNTFCQVIIFLYLLDNETSWMILISAGIGLVIEFWKIKKCVIVEVVRTSSGLPWLKFTDKDSYASKTKEYDVYATKYLSYILYLLVIGYSIYSLIYEEHKSWYSWILGSLVGTVYTFGFIMMTPQLFINYKLKSVAHLPWRTFTYKALNTFIDDLFAFIIKMPTLHRMACFRDGTIDLFFRYVLVKPSSIFLFQTLSSSSICISVGFTQWTKPDDRKVSMTSMKLPFKNSLELPSLPHPQLNPPLLLPRQRLHHQWISHHQQRQEKELPRSETRRRRRMLLRLPLNLQIPLLQLLQPQARERSQRRMSKPKGVSLTLSSSSPSVICSIPKTRVISSSFSQSDDRSLRRISQV